MTPCSCIRARTSGGGEAIAATRASTSSVWAEMAIRYTPRTQRFTAMDFALTGASLGCVTELVLNLGSPHHLFSDSMAIGLIMVGVALVLLLAGNAMTRSAIRSAYGRVDADTVARAPGTGAVPAWISFVMLGAWLLIVIGAIVMVVSLL